MDVRPPPDPYAVAGAERARQRATAKRQSAESELHRVSADIEQEMINAEVRTSAAAMRAHNRRVMRLRARSDVHVPDPVAGAPAT